jgi:hypothetical protein
VKIRDSTGGIDEVSGLIIGVVIGAVVIVAAVLLLVIV